MSFNPRAHVGRDLKQLASQEVLVVSIHAPTWGATASAVFIVGMTCFNPRAHVGRDNNSPLFDFSLLFQSTRPRGARPHQKRPLWPERCFNPRAHVGRDCPRPVDVHSSASFNPRAHVGRDSTASTSEASLGVSIHAPTWGATSAVFPAHSLRALFQSTRPRGARHGQTGGCCLGLVSIHAPTWGATIFRLELRGLCVFQSTRPRGARLNAVTDQLKGAEVSIHAPTWGATALPSGTWP